MQGNIREITSVIFIELFYRVNLLKGSEINSSTIIITLLIIYKIFRFDKLIFHEYLLIQSIIMTIS